MQQNVRGMKGWLKFLGIVNIISGAFTALSLVGIVVAWIPIWLGIVLLQASSRAESFATQGDMTSLANLTNRLKLYFVINGVVLIVVWGLAIIALPILFSLGMFGSFMSQMGY